MTSLRNLVVAHGAGYVPTSIRHALSSIATCGNPWQEDYAGRVKWLKDAGIQGLSQTDDTEVLLFLGCLPGYDQRARKAAESTLCLLQRMGKRVTVLAADEVCCGDTARRVGGTDTFEQVRQTNKNLIAREGIRDVYTLSPHCREGLKMSCRGDEDSIRVSSVLELFNEEYKNGNLCMQGIPPARVTFHDPCFLSKHDAFVQQPRDLLNGIPGVDLVEMAHHGRKSLCCGGGGGGAWRDTKKGERLAEIRLDEAVATGAEILVTACPYCLSMLDAARAGDKKYECLEIMDIGELLWKGVTA
jgi:Fe-S oxidoreductase